MYRYEKMTSQVLEFRWAVPRILGLTFPFPHCDIALSVGRSMICKRVEPAQASQFQHFQVEAETEME
jgi:hypothetical protein